MIYIKLFLSFLQIGVLGFGGGYAILPLIQNVTVQTNGWLTQAEFLNLVTISQMTPGPILLNAATFVGCKMGGVPGGICATVGSVIPSFIIIICLSMLYYRFKNFTVIKTMLKVLKPAVVGLIASAGVSITLMVLFSGSSIRISSLDYIGLGLMITSYIALRLFKANPMLVISASGIVGMCLYLWL